MLYDLCHDGDRFRVDSAVPQDNHGVPVGRGALGRSEDSLRAHARRDVFGSVRVEKICGQLIAGLSGTQVDFEPSVYWVGAVGQWTIPFCWMKAVLNRSFEVGQLIVTAT